MLDDIRKTALKHAMKLSRSYGVREASDIVRGASVFEAYLCGTAAPAIDENSGCIEPAHDLILGDPAILHRHGGKGFPFSVSQGCGYDMNKTFAGCDISNCAHRKNTSQKEKNCGPELPTPSRAETVVPDGGSVTAMGKHTRTDGGAV